jgi:hypothetical protein
MYEVNKIELSGNKVLKIFQDDCYDSPREWCNATTMLFFGTYRHLGDKHDFDSDDYSGWEEMEQAIKRKLNVKHIQKVYGYSHSGLTISLEPFGCQWDSGVLGFVVVTAENVIETQGGKRATKEKVANCVRQIENEVETLDQYIRGDVYGYQLIQKENCDCCGSEDEEVIDSCWGFYGEDIEENGILEYIPEEFHKEIKSKI